MSTPAGPLADVEAEAGRIVEAMSARALAVRLLGGLGVASHVHGAVPPTLRRDFADIDVVMSGRDAKAAGTELVALGYTPNDRFNALHGAKRMLFYDEANGRQLDVFVGEFAMCHRLDLTGRLDLHPAALAASDLLLTKLQIVELNRKDLLDAVRILVAHEVTEDEVRDPSGRPDTLSSGRLVDVTRVDWGWYTTFTDNLGKVAAAAPDLLEPAAAGVVGARIATVLTALAGSRKSTRWKARAMVGRKVPWYELPEEVAGTGAPR